MFIMVLVVVAFFAAIIINGSKNENETVNQTLSDMFPESSPTPTSEQAAPAAPAVDIGETINQQQTTEGALPNRQAEQPPTQDMSSMLGWQTVNWEAELHTGHIVNESHTTSGWIRATDAELLEYASNAIGLSEPFTFDSARLAVGQSASTFSEDSTAIIFGTVRFENLTTDFPFTDSNPLTVYFETSVAGFRRVMGSWDESRRFTLSVFFGNETRHFQTSPYYSIQSQNRPTGRMSSNTWQVNYVLTWPDAFCIPTPNYPEGIDNTIGKHIEFAGRWGKWLGVDYPTVIPHRTWE